MKSVDIIEARLSRFPQGLESFKEEFTIPTVKEPIKHKIKNYLKHLRR